MEKPNFQAAWLSSFPLIIRCSRCSISSRTKMQEQPQRGQLQPEQQSHEAAMHDWKQWRIQLTLLVHPFARNDLIIESLYVEIGRVALVNYGKDYGKLVVIVDVLDQNRALINAPDMVRSQMNFKRLSLTDIKIDINRVPKKKSLIEAMEKADVKNKWENSSWGKKLIVQKRRAALNDFDRFKLMLAKIKKGGLIRQELAKLKKENAA
ncbi:Ribosomal L14e domain-containing protein [Citrus sinensis]|uniref:Ribosomal L14e domain-containing protein n=1 Tax=Citrus sinensis TaxID=2711 RepID=A0ACB8NTN7_CITSI|nr:Ribosomal L14e domain-containing protein [Citrus sinensis]